MLLAQKFTDPAAARSADNAVQTRITARKLIIRQVEDCIHQNAPAAEAGDLQAEFLDRLEGPEFDDDLSKRPIEDIINEIRADLGLGLGGALGRSRWKRRTPEDIAILCQRAAAPCRAKTGPYNLPMPPPGWTGRRLPPPPPGPDPAPARYTAGLPDA
jgi:hypothetical protein